LSVLEDSFQLQDNREGRQKLKELITHWQKKGLEELHCGVESTGGYENNWYHYLKGCFKESKVFVTMCPLNIGCAQAALALNLIT
jgi:transposase